MKQATKRETNLAVTRAVKHSGLPFEKVRNGHWATRGRDIQWELELIYEQAYGDGAFWVAWGARADHVSEILDAEEINSANHATVSGDLGCLARGRGRMCLMALESAQVGRLAKIFWGIRVDTSEHLTERIVGWITGPFSTLMRAQTYLDLAVLLETYPTQHGDRLANPVNDALTFATLAALRALSGDKSAAFAAMSQWRALIGPAGGPAHDLIVARYERVETKLRNMF